MSSTLTGKAGQAGGAAKGAKDSKTLDRLARVGLVSFGIVHLLVGWLALQLALGSSDGSADNQGALAQLSESTGGTILLWILAVGFLSLVVWQLAEAAVGHEEEKDEKKRSAQRVGSLGKAVIFGALAFSSAKAAAGSASGGGGSKEESFTEKLMSAPAGQYLVALVGLVIIGAGLFFIYRGWKEKFRKQLDTSGSGGGRDLRAIVLVGKVGHIAKGLAYSTLGVLVTYAGITHDAEKSGGLDDALKSLLDQPFGSVLVAAIGVGIACFGLYCFGRARYLGKA